MERLIYISESRIDAVDAEEIVARIVEAAQSRNADLAVSGALLFTGTHFAQILEGPPSSVALIMTALRNDPRHGNIFIAARYSISMPIFSGWQMAYHGPSQYIARYINRLLQENPQSDQKRGTERLIQLILEFLAPPCSA